MQRPAFGPACYWWEAAIRADAPRHQLRVLGVAALQNFENREWALIRHYRQNQQVVAAEGLDRLPLITVLVEA